eukprot:scaffold2539_cov388-Prasinococcus_capsulatus_cf.AAC.10
MTALLFCAVVVGGRLIATKVSPRFVALVGGLLFLAFAVHAFMEGGMHPGPESSNWAQGSYYNYTFDLDNTCGIDTRGLAQCGRRKKDGHQAALGKVRPDGHHLFYNLLRD